MVIENSYQKPLTITRHTRNARRDGNSPCSPRPHHLSDVVIFNDTSAEHPLTYEFVKQCTDICEQTYGIPFYWIEFQTYEDAYRGSWKRYSSFRMVKPEPYSDDNPDGYKWRGEVFHELISHHNFLPSRQTRICTSQLKIFITQAFLSEWFARKEATAPFGHFADEQQINDDDLYAQYEKANGKSSKEVFLQRKAYVRQCDLRRDSQLFDDFSSVGVTPFLQSTNRREKPFAIASMVGDDAVDYISLLGIRGDEPLRFSKIMHRARQDDESREHIYMPLVDCHVNQKEVSEFWNKSAFDLELPVELKLSNCVYCFMKGSHALASIHKNMKRLEEDSSSGIEIVPNTPSDINWWIGMEELYRRQADGFSEENRGKKVSIGFFGVNSGCSYTHIKDKSSEIAQSDPAADDLPCHCTD